MNTTSKKFVLILAVCVIVLSAFSIYQAKTSLSDKQESSDISTQTLDTLKIEEKKFIVYTTNIGNVEIWGVTSGTESQDVLIGDADVLGNACAVNLGFNGDTFCTFVLAIPSEPMSLTQIYAIGYDYQGKEVARENFLYSGATEIYNALWGE